MNDIKIMLVEDESITAFSIKKMLETLSYSVTEALTSGESALKRIPLESPDLVLMDIVLEGAMDGIEAATYIKEKFDIPVVYITSSTDKHTLDRAKKSEPYGYIIKPVNINELYTTIETVLYRHRLSQKLRHSEFMYRTLIETISQGIVEYDRDGLITFCNESFCSMTGFRRDQIIGKPFSSIIKSEIHFNIKKHAGTSPESYKRYTRYYDTIVNDQGRSIDVQIDWDFKYDENAAFTGIIAVITDITDRKQSEMLRKIEHDSAVSLSTSTDFDDTLAKIAASISEIPDIVSLCLFASKQGDAKISLKSWYNVPEDIKETIRELPRESDERVFLFAESTVSTGITHLPGLLDRLVKNNETRAACVIPISGENEYMASMLCLFRSAKAISPPLRNTLENIAAHTASVIKRISVESELKQSEARYRKLIQTMNDGIFILDQDDMITYANDKFCKILDYPPEQIIGSPVTKYMDGLNKRVFLMVMGPGYVAEYNSMDIEWINNKGATVYTILSPQSMTEHESGRKERFAVVTDITEHRKLEQELIKIQKLESLSLLAGGIAHDYNNILTGILGNINLAKLNIDSESDIYNILDEAEQASLKARDISQQLLTFSRGGDPVKKPVDIRDILYGSASFSLRGSNVKSEFFIDTDLWAVEADEAQFSQVIDNIIINAMQAMPEGGTVQISASNAPVGPMDNLPLEEGKYVKISIRDQGPGIPEEFSEKIFDLFFTTKQKGNGIGLATSFSIIKRHSGHLYYETSMGEGTVFYVFLPATESPLPEKKAGRQNDSSKKQGRILVMDDEEIIRKIVDRMLGKIGYTVEMAHDGSEAVSMYRKADEENNKYDLVLMDLTVPGGMGGIEASEKILGIDPEAVIIASSGYANDPIRTNFKNFGFRNFLPKPFRIDELLAVINESIH